MTLFNLVLVALIQGVTEFLPVSSSGHLALLPQLTGLDDQGQVIDVAAHVGTLFAVVIYFWSDVKLALAGTLRLLKGKIDTQGAFLALCLLVATIPVIMLGYNRSDAARLSMLMSIPTILASAALLSLDVMGTPGVMYEITVVAVMSFVAALCALFLMMKLLESVSYTPYVIYRIILGVILLVVAYA